MGNDFLPHLPTLDIGDGGLDKLIQIYKDSLGEMGGYLNQQGVLHLERCACGFAVERALLFFRFVLSDFASAHEAFLSFLIFHGPETKYSTQTHTC